MELKIILQVLLRRKWIIIQSLIIITASAILATKLMHPRYTSTATVLQKAPDTESTLLSSIGMKNTTAMAEIETQMSLITISPLLKKVIHKLQLRAGNGDLLEPDKFIKSSLLPKIKPAPFISVEEIDETDLIEISATSIDPEESVMIANTMAEMYIDYNVFLLKKDLNRLRGFVTEKIASSKVDYLNSLNAIRDFQVRKMSIDLEIEKKTTIERMAELIKEKEDTLSSIVESTEKFETAKKQLKREGIEAISSTTLNENSQIEMLKQSLSNLEIDLAEMLLEKLPSHPSTQALERRISKVKEQLRDEIISFQNSSEILQVLERDIVGMKSRVKEIGSQIDQQKLVLEKISGKVFDYSPLMMRLSVRQGLHESLLEYLYQIGIAEAMTISYVKFISSASDDPKSKPSMVINIILGLFLGLLFGTCLAFLVEYLDDSVKTSKDIRAQGLTFLGSVPKFKKGAGPLISLEDPKDPICESYRMIRNDLKMASLDKPIITLQITSSKPKESRTSTALNLAVSFATEGKNTLLVDGDLRRPSIHDIFHKNNKLGLTSLLTDKQKILEVIQKSDIDCLSLLTSGPVPPDPGQTVGSIKMKELIRSLSNKFDIIVFDSSPVMVDHDDSITFAQYMDGIILVTEQGRTTRHELFEVKEIMEYAKLLPTGAILTKFVKRS